MRVKSLLCFSALLVLSVLAGCAGPLQLDDALAVAPYRIEANGRIVVAVKINDRGPFDFVLDTGSSISAAFDDVRDALSLATLPGKRVIVHGAVASGTFPLLDVEHIELGGESWSEPRLVWLPGTTAAVAGADGILGLDFLKQYAVAVGAKERVIRLYPRELVAQRAYRGWDSVPFSPRSIGAGAAELFFIDITIDGWEVPAVFDLGAGFNMINWPGARSLGIRRERLGPGQVISGALQSEKVMARLDADVVRTAGIRWRDEIFSIADLDIFDVFGLAGSPAAILGAGLFTQRDFIMDFARGRLLVRYSMAEVDPEREAAMPSPPALKNSRPGQ